MATPGTPPAPGTGHHSPLSRAHGGLPPGPSGRARRRSRRDGGGVRGGGVRAAGLEGPLRLQRGRGREACSKKGYRGRTGLHELLVGSDELGRLIRARASADEIRRRAMEEGMETLVQDGILKVLDGWTDARQVLAAAIR